LSENYFDQYLATDQHLGIGIMAVCVILRGNNNPTSFTLSRLGTTWAVFLSPVAL
jgi:hypothetical protein